MSDTPGKETPTDKQAWRQHLTRRRLIGLGTVVAGAGAAAAVKPVKDFVDPPYKPYPYPPAPLPTFAPTAAPTITPKPFVPESAESVNERLPIEVKGFLADARDYNNGRDYTFEVYFDYNEDGFKQVDKMLRTESSPQAAMYVHPVTVESWQQEVIKALNRLMTNHGIHNVHFQGTQDPIFAHLVVNQGILVDVDHGTSPYPHSTPETSDFSGFEEFTAAERRTASHMFLNRSIGVPNGFIVLNAGATSIGSTLSHAHAGDIHAQQAIESDMYHALMDILQIPNLRQLPELIALNRNFKDYTTIVENYAKEWDWAFLSHASSGGMVR